MYTNLTDFIDTLRQADELIEIEAPVSPRFEITEITDRISKQPGGGKALLFKNTGTGFPVLTNMMGSDRRISLALGVERLENLTERIETLFKQISGPKETFADKLKVLPLLGKVSRWLPKFKKGRGACQEVVEMNPDLSKLPILTCWKYDGRPFVTLPLVHTKDPLTGIRNVGMYRMQVFSPDSTGMHWHRHKTGARHYEEYKKQGRKMPVTVCLGGDPAYTYSATAPVPDNIDEYLLAGFLRQKPVELVKCLTNELEIPADCDFVIEGYVDPAEEKTVEGPFGDHTGFYSLEDLYPVFHVTCITHRKNAVYPATIVGIPPQEDAYIAKATERIFLAPIRLVMQPEITDLFMPEEGVAHNIALIDMEKSYPGQAFKTASSLWGAGQMMFNKFMFLTSGNVDLRNPEILAGLIGRIEIPRDILCSKGPLDVLDHTSDIMGLGGKLCIDATEKLPEEIDNHAPARTSLPREWNLSDPVLSVNTSFAEKWKTLFLFVREGRRTSPTDIYRELKRKNPMEGIKFVFLFDDRVDPDDVSTLIWFAASNCDGARDTAIVENTLLFDARIKACGLNGFSRRWPNVVTTDRETIRYVDRRWTVYQCGKFLPSPSLKYQRLVSGEGAEFIPPENNEAPPHLPK